jgi:hypothetical protein
LAIRIYQFYGPSDHPFEQVDGDRLNSLGTLFGVECRAQIGTQAQSTYTPTYTFFAPELNMAQITLYLDDATQALVDEAAKANGVSKSRWVADIIRTYAAHDWPQDCLALAGRFADFPLKTDAPCTQPADMPRLIY